MQPGTALQKIPNQFFYGFLFISLVALDYFNFHPALDISTQQQMVINFVDGHGMSVSRIDYGNNLFYEVVSYWAPGLVMFMVPFYCLTRSTLFSIVCIKLISLVFFILFLARFLNYLGITDLKKKIVILFLSFSVAPFIHFYPSDILATVICLWGFYYFIKYQVAERKTDMVFSVLLLALGYFIKYSFLPFLLYPAAAYFLQHGKKVWLRRKQFLFIVAISVVAILITYALNLYFVGKTSQDTSMDALQGKAHWEQLSQFSGFLFTSNPGFEQALYDLVNYYIISRVRFSFVSIGVTVYFFGLFIYYFFSGKKQVVNTPFRHSLNASLAAGALIVFFLAFLTINVPGQTWKQPYWTFVEETRYYGPVIIIGLINALVIMLQKKKLALLHLVIGGMFVLNIAAFIYSINNGFYKSNFGTYLHAKKMADITLRNAGAGQIPVVYFDRFTKKSELYNYLLAERILLTDEPHPTMKTDKRFAIFSLVKDTINYQESFRLEKGTPDLYRGAMAPGQKIPIENQ